MMYSLGGLDLSSTPMAKYYIKDDELSFPHSPVEFISIKSTYAIIRCILSEGWIPHPRPCPGTVPDTFANALMRVDTFSNAATRVLRQRSHASYHFRQRCQAGPSPTQASESTRSPSQPSEFFAGAAMRVDTFAPQPREAHGRRHDP